MLHSNKKDILKILQTRFAENLKKGQKDDNMHTEKRKIKKYDEEGREIVAENVPLIIQSDIHLEDDDSI